MSARACWFTVVSILVAWPALGQELIPHHQDAPPGPALSPAEAAKKMTVPEGFTVEVVASEPDIVNPVAMTFDEKGRTWITESLEYPRKSPGKGRDRVKILEDTDADGRADKFSVFAEGLNIPSGIAVGHGGVWVANAPDILFYPDADRDGQADGPPKTVVTGFGRADTHELPNSLTWGPDGYLYGLNGVFNHSHVKYTKENPNYKEDHPGWPITCAMFRIHPVTREFEVFCEGTSNPWGIAFDHEGSAFVSACVIDHLWHLVRTGYYHRQGGPYPPFTWKIESIVKHKHQKAAYCGIHYFDSDAYPEQYRNKLYMGNIHGNCINVDKLQRDGSTYFATGEPDFLSANDAWFMPVVQKTGPDGCLWVLDWYDRYHCYQDANRDPDGIDRLKGRLYRVRYKDTPRAKAFDLTKESNERLFERLASGNGLMRDLSLRVLLERRAATKFTPDDEIVSTARRLALDEKKALSARIHAVSVAVALAPADSMTTLLGTLLDQRDAALRAWAVRIINNRKGPLSLFERVRELVSDKSPDVQLQAVIAVSQRKAEKENIETLVRGLATCGEDELIPHIVWQNLHPLLEDHPDQFVKALEVLISQTARAEYIGPREWAIEKNKVKTFTALAVERLLARRDFDAKPIASISALLRFRNAHRDAVFACFKSISEKVHANEIRGERLNQLREAFAPHLKSYMENAVEAPNSHAPLLNEAAILAVSLNDPRGLEMVRFTFSNEGLESSQRLRSLAAMIAAKDPTVPTAVAKALSQATSSSEFSGQLLATLGRLDDPAVASNVLAIYVELNPDTKPKAIELLTQRAAWAKPLFAEIEAGKVNVNALNVNQIKRVLSFKDKELTAAVAKHYGTVRTTRDPARDQIVSQMRTLVRGIKGDPHRGVLVFNRVCGQCHKIHGQGQDVGPDITANGRASFEQLLSNVFDPSLVIGSAYQARTVQCTDGRVLTGLVAEDSPERIVLKVQGGKLETIPRADVEATKLSELSLMPEGLEKQLQPQEIADLFAFISLDKHPDDPLARPIPSGAEARR